MAPRRKKCLIFDADDTLWENNIYFEAAIEEFLDLTADLIGPTSTVAPHREAVLDILREIEIESIPRCGYGSCHFVNSLRETFRHLYTGTDGIEYLRGIDGIEERLINHPMVLMPDVAPTLEALRRSYRLLVFTKGDQEEQAGKVERSGLKHYFDEVEITREKHIDAYHELVERHILDRDCTIMIGNSPRSDILPALDAGLWAVFVPHTHTWDFEHEAERLRLVMKVEPHPRLLVAQSLSEIPSLLARVFPH
ncbi:MAG: HAD family hydrolase [Acidobacteria bacterium]|nr:HAD family hydrolase [Acidobacteriota bacterium]